MGLRLSGWCTPPVCGTRVPSRMHDHAPILAPRILPIEDLSQFGPQRRQRGLPLLRRRHDRAAPDQHHLHILRLLLAARNVTRHRPRQEMLLLRAYLLQFRVKTLPLPLFNAREDDGKVLNIFAHRQAPDRHTGARTTGGLPLEIFYRLLFNSETATDTNSSQSSLINVSIDSTVRHPQMFGGLLNCHISAQVWNKIILFSHRARLASPNFIKKRSFLLFTMWRI